MSDFENENIYFNSKLVEGFQIHDNSIICEMDSVIIGNKSIEVLNLSCRCLNALFKVQIFTLADLLGISLTELERIRNLGVKSVSEICYKLREYLELKHSENKMSMTCKINDDFSIVTLIECVSEYVPIEKLGLSTRPYNCLKNNGIDYLSQISTLGLDDLKSITNMGQKSVEEISNVVSAFIGYEDDTIFAKCKPVRIPDASVKALQLCDDDYSTLYKNDIETIGQIVNYSYIQLNDIFNDSVFSKRIVDSLSKYKKECMQTGKMKDIEDTGICVTEEQINKTVDVILSARRKLAFLNSEKIEKFINGLLDRISSEPSVVMQIHDIRDIMSAEKIISEYKIYLCDCLKKNQFTGIDCNEFRDILPGFIDDATKEIVENELLKSGKIRVDNGRYFMNYPSFADFLDKSDERSYSVINKRIEGKTLEEIAFESGNITRERIRQLENKYMRNVLKRISIAGGMVQEDIYKYIYITYDLNSDFLKDYLHLSDPSIYYLNYLYKGCKGYKNKKPAVEALDDSKIPAPLRLKIESYVYRKYVKIENHYIPAKRGLIEDALLPVFAKEDISFDDFIKLVNEYVTDIGRPEFIIKEESFKVRYNRFSMSNKVLSKYNQMMRYYEISSRDYSEFYETLNLHQFKDIEISAKKLLDDNPVLMREYDIYDEYELHNLIKKTILSNEYPDVNLKRTPFISFGKADREKQVKDLLIELSPISVNNFAEAYSEKYGVNPLTVYANFTKYICEYNNHSVYEIEVPQLNQNELEQIKPFLIDEFYLTDTIRQIYLNKFPDGNLDKINHFSLRQLGFRVYNGYVIDNKYRNAAEYFDYLLTCDDVIDISKYKFGLIQINSFCLCMRKYQENYDLIEFSKYKYINVKRITEMSGLTKEDIYCFCENVVKFVGNNFFTIASIRSEGFADNLDMLGFKDYFFASLIQENSKYFKCFRIGNNRVFRVCTSGIKFSDFIEWLLYQTDSLSMDIYDILSLLSEKYNINVKKHKIKDALIGTPMYYNESTEKVYADYEVYFEEI